MTWTSKDPLLNRLWKALKQEPEKYRKLGWGKYLALFTITLYFTVYLDVLRAIWPSIYGILPDPLLYSVTIVSVNLIVTVIYNLAMIPIYRGKYPFFEQHRVDKNLAWPWEKDPQGWPKMLVNSILTTLFNVLVVAFWITYIDALKEFTFIMDPAEQPPVWTMLWQVAFMFVVQEIGFYFVHRMVHHPSLYWIHKKHHNYYSTIALAAQYCNPIEQALANVIPTGIGYKILSFYYPVHIYSIIIWLTFRMFETNDGHCGYDWPWSQAGILPFSAGGNYHSFHHSKNSGNYAAILHFLDTVFATNDDFQRAEAKKEVSKEQVKSQ